jgi:hypothetical protein
MIRYALAVLLIAVSAQARAQDQDRGLAIWSKIYQVFSHPRCANCHVGDDVPIWSGASYGAARPHGMNIHAGSTGDGAEAIACTTCHTPNNSQTPHGPPGAIGWKLPPAKMQWFGKSSAEICGQIKDPARSLASIGKIAEHIETEPLVKWGWSPGAGREPAPYSVYELVEFVKQWDEAGAPCPAK